jgi:tetratricopeptide (TPR) repeat protein
MRTSLRVRLVPALFLLCALPAACKRHPAPLAAAPAAKLAASAPAERRTTSGAIAADNLDAQIVGLERAHAAPDHELGHTLGLVGAVGARGHYLGRVVDLERADRLAEEAVASAPRDPAALLARAGTRAALHRFAEARADLDAAAAVGAGPEKLARARATLSLALGHISAALPVFEQQAAAAPSIDSLGTLAAVYGQLGRTDEAHARFAAALAAYRDVSPFPVAWLEFEEGQMWEREGQLARARALYASAHARLPVYEHATAHLAGLLAEEGERAAAIALLAPLLASSDDPEIPAQLATLYTAEGRRGDAAAMLGRARQGYDERLARHPEAFADHAARFFMGVGGDPGRARTLARANLERRQSEPAYQLAIEAALAAGANADACHAADGARRLDHLGKPLLAAAWRAYTACGQKRDADAIDVLLARR